MTKLLPLVLLAVAASADDFDHPRMTIDAAAARQRAQAASFQQLEVFKAKYSFEGMRPAKEPTMADLTGSWRLEAISDTTESRAKPFDGRSLPAGTGVTFTTLDTPYYGAAFKDRAVLTGLAVPGVAEYSADEARHGAMVAFGYTNNAFAFTSTGIRSDSLVASRRSTVSRQFNCRFPDADHLLCQVYQSEFNPGLGGQKEREIWYVGFRRLP